MLSIVPTLEEFRGMLLGANFHVFTHHKKLDIQYSQHVMRTMPAYKIEKFLPMLQYIEAHSII